MRAYRKGKVKDLPPDIDTRRSSEDLGRKSDSGDSLRKEKKKIDSSQIGSPTSFKHIVHVDSQYEWGGEESPADSFKFLQKLGEGSYGAAYLAVHNQDSFKVAIKVVPLSGNESEKSKLKKELELLKKCRDTNVVKYYGFSLLGQDMWIIMEYCQGGSIRDIMDLLQRPLKEEEVAAVCHDTLKGLAYLQQLNIVHNDIKASNILLSSEGEAKIADFGVSEQLSTSLFPSKGLVGSPYWMSPESISQLKTNFMSDIWSLGITAIEMAEGVPPYTHLNPGLAIRVISRSPPPTLTKKEFSKNFRDFLTKCLDLEPSNRWTAEKLLTHPFLKKVKSKPILKKIAQDFVQKNSNKPINNEPLYFSAFDGSTPVWGTVAGTSKDGTTSSTKEDTFISHRPQIGSFLYNSKFKTSFLGESECRSIGTQTDPIGCWAGILEAFSSLFSSNQSQNQNQNQGQANEKSKLVG